jgi:hypothetical protein
MSNWPNKVTTFKPKSFLIEGSNQIYENFNFDDPNSHSITSPDDYFFMKEIDNIRLILPWFIFTIGLIGNSLILIIFLRPSALRYFNSNSFCFCALAISDLIALIFMVLRSLLTSDLIGNVAASCKIIKFIYYSSLQISAWCLVLLTLDRLIAVMFVFKYITWSKKWHSVKVLVAIVITILLINLHILIYVTADTIDHNNPARPPQIIGRPDNFVPSNLYPNSVLSQNSQFHPHSAQRQAVVPLSSNRQPQQQQHQRSTKYVCQVDRHRFPTYFKYIYSKWDIYHAAIYGALPFIIILISNILIIYKLKFFRNSKVNKSPVQSSDDQQNGDKGEEEDEEEEKNNKQSISRSSSVNSLRKFRSYQINIMLISVAFIFILLASPISIYMAFIYENITKNVRYAKREYIKVILRYICYFNNAINFYVYFAFSSQFRKNFLSLFGCRFDSTTDQKPNKDDKNGDNNNDYPTPDDLNDEYADSAIKELGIMANISSNIENLSKKPVNKNDRSMYQYDYDDNIQINNNDDDDDDDDDQDEPNYTNIVSSFNQKEKPVPSPRKLSNKSYQPLPTDEDFVNQTNVNNYNRDGEDSLIKDALLNGDLRYYPKPQPQPQPQQSTNNSFSSTKSTNKLLNNNNPFNYMKPNDNKSNNSGSNNSSFNSQHQNNNKFYGPQLSTNNNDNNSNNGRQVIYSQASSILNSQNSGSVFEFPDNNNNSYQATSTFKNSNNNAQKPSKAYISPKPSIV